LRIGVLLDGSSARQRLLEGIEAHDAGWELELLPNQILATEEPLTHYLRAQSYAGMIVAVPHDRIDEVRGCDVPVVSANEAPPPCVTHDDQAVGELAAAHLLDSGSQRFGFCGIDVPFSRIREGAFVQALARAGHRCAVLSQGGGEARYTMGALAQGEPLAPWLEAIDKPVAVLCASDEYALLLQRAALKLGYRVPDDVAVLGVDNSVHVCTHAPVELSSIELNHVGVGYEAARLLAQLIRTGAASPDAIRVPPRRVVPRRSTAPVLHGSPQVKVALSYIQQHACLGINVDDVAEASGLSLSRLHREFKEAVGCTPGAEIRRVRLETAKKLIEGTDLTLSEIALKSGFSSGQYLSDAFQREFGVTPSEFRRARA
jgi:LacI family transcriptional regulator